MYQELSLIRISKFPLAPVLTLNSVWRTKEWRGSTMPASEISLSTSRLEFQSESFNRFSLDVLTFPGTRQLDNVSSWPNGENWIRKRPKPRNDRNRTICYLLLVDIVCRVNCCRTPRSFSEMFLLLLYLLLLKPNRTWIYPCLGRSHGKETASKGEYMLFPIRSITTFQDKLYLTAREWKESFGGHKDGNSLLVAEFNPLSSFF